MPVIARDSVASDHLVYAWPFPIGPEEHEVSCAEDELVVMCPAWLVGDRLGPGRHRWRTPDPSRPVSAYFVLTAPVEVSFDMITQFLVPTTGQGVRLRALGSLQVRCMDPALLVAQFVGLPFDAVNDGVVRSVSRSIERMLARLLTRRVVAAGTPMAVTDPSMLQNIIEELVAYNPTAGAVFGVELMRVGRLAIAADDGSRPWQQMVMQNEPAETRRPTPLPVAPSTATTQEVPLLETARGTPKSRATAATLPPPAPQPKKRDSQPNIASGEIGGAKPKQSWPQNEVSGEIGGPKPRAATQPPTEVSGEIGPKPRPGTPPPTQVSGEIGGAKPRAATQPPAEVSGEISGTHREKKKTSLGLAVSDPAIPLPKLPTTTPTGSQPGRPAIPPIPPTPSAFPTTPPPGIDVARTPPPGSLQASMASPGAAVSAGTPPPQPTTPGESRGAILGIGVAHIGSSQVASGEITKKIAPGGRVLVPGPNGLMQSATVLQLLQGYYELEVGGSGETIWVPVSGVVPE